MVKLKIHTQGNISSCNHKVFPVQEEDQALLFALLLRLSGERKKECPQLSENPLLLLSGWAVQEEGPAGSVIEGGKGRNGAGR